VLEYINRRGDAPNESFTPEEMDKAAFFAEAVSSLVSTYESAKLFRDFGENVLAHDFSQDVPAIRAWLAGLRDSAEHREMMDLAVMLREISSRGEPERALCGKMLEAMMKYMDHNAETSFLNL
jgi:hypothetical protein